MIDPRFFEDDDRPGPLSAVARVLLIALAVVVGILYLAAGA